MKVIAQILVRLKNIKLIHVLFVVLLLFYWNTCTQMKKQESRLIKNIGNITDSLETIIKNNTANVVVNPNYWTRQEAEVFFGDQFKLIRKDFGIKNISTGIGVDATAETWSIGEAEYVSINDLNKLLDERFNLVGISDSVFAWDYSEGFFDVKGGLVGGSVFQTLKYNLHMGIYKGKERRWDKKGFFNKINLLEKREPKVIYTSPDTTLKFNNVEYNEFK